MGALPAKVVIDERFGFPVPPLFYRFLAELAARGGASPWRALGAVGLSLAATPLETPVLTEECYTRYPATPPELRLFAWTLCDGGAYGFLIDDPADPPAEPSIARFWPFEQQAEHVGRNFGEFLAGYLDECTGYLAPPVEPSYETQVLFEGGAEVLWAAGDAGVRAPPPLSEFEGRADALTHGNPAWELLVALVEALGLPRPADGRRLRERAKEARRLRANVRTADGCGLVLPEAGLDPELCLLPWRELGGLFEGFFRRADLARAAGRGATALAFGRNLQILAALMPAPRAVASLIATTELMADAYQLLGRTRYAEECRVQTRWLRGRAPRS